MVSNVCYQTCDILLFFNLFFSWGEITCVWVLNLCLNYWFLQQLTRSRAVYCTLFSVRHYIVCSSCYPFKLILCSPLHCLFFLLPLQTYSLFAITLSVLLVTPSNLFSVRHSIVCSSCYPFKRFSVRHSIVCSSCYPFKLILCSPLYCLFFLVPLQTYALFAMALSVLLVTPSNLFSVCHGIVYSSCYPFKRFLSVAMALSGLLVTPSNLFSVRHCIVYSSCRKKTLLTVMRFRNCLKC